MAISVTTWVRSAARLAVTGIAIGGFLTSAGVVSAQSISNNSLFSGNPALPTTNPALPTPQGLPAHNQMASTGGAQGNLSPDYQLGAGDHVRITVFGQPDLSGEYQVDGSGNLAFPLIGDVRAGGGTAGELQQAITSKLSPGFIKNASVSVEIMNYRPFYIIGEVKTGGPYPYTSGMTVLTAVATAGGFTYRAKENIATIRRVENGRAVRVEANQDTPVMPGDVITVPERFF